MKPDKANLSFQLSEMKRHLQNLLEEIPPEYSDIRTKLTLLIIVIERFPVDQDSLDLTHEIICLLNTLNDFLAEAEVLNDKSLSTKSEEMPEHAKAEAIESSPDISIEDNYFFDLGRYRLLAVCNKCLKDFFNC